MTFDEVIGQREVSQRLVQMVEEGRLPHAIMLCGPQGVGKLALATAFGCYLLGSPANGSEEPPMLKKLEHPDLHFTFPTIKLPSMGSVHKPVSDDFIHEWRELLRQTPYFSLNQWLSTIGAENQQALITAGESDELTHKLYMKSSQGGRKVSIIWLPERMNLECANKLLKLIEEPPAQTYFVMACEEPDLLLETIRSRVQRIDVPRLGQDVILQALIERRGLGESDAKRISRIATGNWLRALQELQADSEGRQFLELYMQLMRLAYQRKVRELKKWSETVSGFGREKQKRFLEYFLHMTRECFVFNFQQEELVFMTTDEEAFARNFSRFVNEANILQFYDLASLALRDIGQNANGKIVFYDFAIQVIMLILQKP